MGLILGGVSAQDLILDGQSVSLYAGGNPPTKVWPTRETVQITLGTGAQAMSQLRAALSARGLDYRTVEEIPFDIELVGTGSTQGMYDGCSALTHAPNMDTSRVTNMVGMFNDCAALIHVPDLDTSQVTDMESMFYGCASLTDGNVRLIGRHPNVNTSFMIYGSGLTREPWYNADGTPREMVQITLGTGTQARDEFRAELTARGLGYRTVEEIPFDIELVGRGSAQSMFDSCSALTSVPEIDTSSVTTMNSMFYGCSALTSVPEMNTVQVTNMQSMFYGCSALTSVPEIDTSSVTTMNGMFRNCALLTYVPDLNTERVTDVRNMFRSCSALTDGNVRLVGRHHYANTTDMIRDSGLTRLPFYDTAGNPI